MTYRFLEWLERRELLLEGAVLLEARTDDIDATRAQINGMFDDAIRTLLQMGRIAQDEHVNQAKKALRDGYDWWAGLLKVMREYPYKGPDLYDAATHLAGDLWENVFDPRKYDDRNPPLAIFHRMAAIRGQDVAFRFFGWRRKLKTANYTDLSPDEAPVAAAPGDTSLEAEWKELQAHLVRAVEREATRERNPDRGRRAIDVLFVKLSGHSRLYGKRVNDTGLDGLATFYHVNRREMYDTLLVVYRAVRDAAREMDGADGLLDKVMGQLPTSLTRDPEEVILGLMPDPPGEISHSDLFTRAYSANRELKSLTFKRIIQGLVDRDRIRSRKDDRVGKHQTLYSLLT